MELVRMPLPQSDACARQLLLRPHYLPNTKGGGTPDFAIQLLYILEQHFPGAHRGEPADEDDQWLLTRGEILGEHIGHYLAKLATTKGDDNHTEGDSFLQTYVELEPKEDRGSDFEVAYLMQATQQRRNLPGTTTSRPNEEESRPGPSECQPTSTTNHSKGGISQPQPAAEESNPEDEATVRWNPPSLLPPKEMKWTRRRYIGDAERARSQASALLRTISNEILAHAPDAHEGGEDERARSAVLEANAVGFPGVPDHLGAAARRLAQLRTSPAAARRGKLQRWQWALWKKAWRWGQCLPSPKLLFELLGD